MTGDVLVWNGRVANPAPTRREAFDDPGAPELDPRWNEAVDETAPSAEEHCDSRASLRSPSPGGSANPV